MNRIMPQPDVKLVEWILNWDKLQRSEMYRILYTKLLKEGNAVSSTLFVPGRNQWLAFPENQHTESCHCLYVLQKNKNKNSKIFLLYKCLPDLYFLSDFSQISYFQKPALPGSFAINSVWQKLIISSLEFSISVHFFI